jgi:hypothetical protein
VKRRIAVPFLLAASLATPPLAAATIVIHVTDAAGQGFNDTTPVTPVGGNTGTTLGQQRMLVFQEVARIWGSLIPSNVTIKVDSSFQPLTCSATSAVLGQTSATSSVSDFANAPRAHTWYARAEADKLSGTELDPATSAMNATFNSQLGQTGCLDGTFFYLGLDNAAGNDVNLQTVVLHEFAHGLGFYSKVSSTTGSFPQGMPGAYDRFLFDATLGKQWDQITDTQRFASTTNAGNVVWSGPNATTFAQSYLDRGRLGLSVSAPAAAAGAYAIGTASFGPAVSGVSVSGQVAAATDAADSAGPTTTDACSALTNAPAIAGKIALVDRGNCNFTVKVKNAQNAGAVAVIVADNNGSESPIGMGGTDATITIPSVLVSLSDGARLRANLPATAFLGLDLTQYSGADASGRLVMFTPNPWLSGSSVSHWDEIATPSLLMQPYISSDLTLTTDATLPALKDLGWFNGSTAIPTTYVLPSSAHAQGANGAFYRTGLWVTNTGAAASTIALKFLGHDQDGTGGPTVSNVVVPAGQTVTFPDVLNSPFNVSNGYGAILVSADSNQLKVVSQTSTPPPSGGGTFGQAVPAAVGNDPVTPAAPKALFSLRQDDAFRTNVVIANTTTAAAHVDLMLYDSSGVRIGSGAADLSPLEMAQIGAVVTALGGPVGTKDAFLVVSTPTGGARIATYAAVIDQHTNDPRTIRPVTLGNLGANATWLLPSSAHKQGANGAFYTTDLTAANTDSSAATVTLKFLGHDQDGTAGPEVVETVPANSEVTFTDVLGKVFGLSDDYGAILVTSSSTNVKVLSQSSTPPPEGVGTFGQSVPAAGPADFVTYAAPRVLVGLRQDSAFRTNAVIANATNQAADVVLTLTSAAGAALGTGSYHLLPYQMTQVGTVVTALGAPDGTADAALTVSTTTPGARIATYAAIIDQVTNDPRTVLP